MAALKASTLIIGNKIGNKSEKARKRWTAAANN